MKWSQQDFSILRNDHINNVPIAESSKKLNRSIDEIYHMIYDEYNVLLQLALKDNDTWEQGLKELEDII
jgi:hypothetical protein